MTSEKILKMTLAELFKENLPKVTVEKLAQMGIKTIDDVTGDLHKLRLFLEAVKV